MNDVINRLINIEKKYGIAEALRPFEKNINVEIPLHKNVINLGVEELILTTREYNGLKRAHIDTIKSLVDSISNGEIYNIKNLGIKSVIRIKIALLQIAYSKLNEPEKDKFWAKVIEANL